MAIERTNPLKQAESKRRLLRLLVQGEEEIAEGLGIDLDTVLAEADALLEAEDV